MTRSPQPLARHRSLLLPLLAASSRHAALKSGREHRSSSHPRPGSTRTPATASGASPTSPTPAPSTSTSTPTLPTTSRWSTTRPSGITRPRPRHHEDAACSSPIPPPANADDSPTARFGGGARAIVVGHKTNSVFFTRTDPDTHTNALYKADTNTGEIRKLIDLPAPPRHLQHQRRRDPRRRHLQRSPTSPAATPTPPTPSSPTLRRHRRQPTPTPPPTSAEPTSRPTTRAR